MVLTNEQKQQIREMYGEYMKGSEIRFNDSCGRTWIKFMASCGKEERYNTYDTNDCLWFVFEICDLGEGQYKLISHYHNYLIKPLESYYAYSRRDVPFRQVKGDFKKVLGGLERFIQRATESLANDLDNGNLSERNESDYYGRDVRHNVIVARHLVR